MRRLRWISVLSLCVASFCVAACADDGGGSALSTEDADAACSSAADGVAALGMARVVFDDARAAEATEALTNVAETVTGTEVEAEFRELADATHALVEAFADRASLSELAPVLLESGRASAEVGLWCIEHVSADLVDDVAREFVTAS